MLARAETAEHPRSEVQAQRRHFLALIVAADQIAGRSLSVPAAPAVEGIEADQRNENPLSSHLELPQLGVAQADRALERDALLVT